MLILMIFFIAVVIIELAFLAIFVLVFKKLCHCQKILFKTRFLVLDIKKDFSGRIEAGKIITLYCKKGFDLLNKSFPWWLKLIFWLSRRVMQNKTLNRLKTDLSFSKLE